MVEVADHWPTEIRLAKNRRALTVSFDDGSSYTIPAELLRVCSPSAEVQGHAPDQRVTVPGKRNVEIIGVEAVGAYAVKLSFDDLHDTGLYTWSQLYDFGVRQEEIFADYVAELMAKGLSR